ncbi:MAG: hypothetical protein P8Y14_18555 [Anaerolineales bacterium]|jgi:hypothetical protein
MEKLNLSKSKNLRQKLLMVYHNDGILDMVVGITVVMLAIVMAFEAMAFIGLIGIPLVLYIPIKERLSIPRIGFIRFEAEDVTRKRMAIFVLLGMGTFVVFSLLFLLRVRASPGLIELLRNNLVLIFALFLGGTLFAAAHILNNARFFVYALLSLGLVLGANFIGLRVWVPVALVGLLMEASGIYKLVNFLQEYPLEADE